MNTLVPQPQPLERHPAAVYLASLTSAHSRRTMHTALNTLASLLTNRKADAFYIAWEALRYPHTAALRSKLAESCAPATANKLLSALRGVLKACWRLGLMSAEDYTRACDVPNVRAETLPAGRELDHEELLALLHACNEDKNRATGIRDAALISMLYTCGLRRSEIVTLTLEDYHPPTGKLVVRGKGRKERTVYAANRTKKRLESWLNVRGRAAGALFCPINKSGKIARKSMTAQVVYNILVKRGAQAGITDFSPHDFRRTFVSDMLDAGVDIALVAKLAGHADTKTTARYDRRPEEAKRTAAGRLDI
jgi:site-specific recombinase XerD